jgi:uncharacterized repeat protein (TIGR01451 family)
MPRCLRTSLPFLLMLMGSSGAALAKDEAARPIRRTTAEVMRAPAPGTDLVERRLGLRRRARHARLARNPDSPALSRWQPANLGTPAEAPPPQALGTTFPSVTLAEVQVQPPDTMGAVGPTQFLTHVNGRVRVHDKATGAVGALDADDLVFWDSVRTKGSGDFVSFPHVRYDRLTDRWFLMLTDLPLGVGTTQGVSNRVLIAVSDSGTITAGTVWHFFYFNIDAALPAGNSSCLADYPSLGLDASALYVGANIYCGIDRFNLDFVNTSAWVIRKSALLDAATPANLVATGGAVTAFRNLQGPASVGLSSPQGVDNVSPSATTGYFVGVDGSLFGRLVLRTVLNPGSGSPSLGPNVFLDVADTESPIPVPNPSGPDLDAIDDSLMNAVLRNGTLYTSHQIQVNGSGDASPIGGRNGVRWYAIDVGTASVTQLGTIFDSAASNPNSYWMASVGVSGQGHVAFGSTVAGASMSPSAATAGRLASDPPGAAQAPLVYKAAEGTYNPSPTSDLWGDYSMTTLDPCDDMSMWTIQEFAAAGNNWGTQVARLLAPPPGTPTASSTILPQGQTALGLRLTGANWYDPPIAGMSACRTSIGVAVGGGVGVNSTSYVDPTRIDLNLSTVGTPVGAKTVTITNPDGQTAAATILNVVSVPVITATKTVATSPVGPFVAGAGIVYTVTLRNTGTFAQGDDAGNELTDVLPSALTLVSANASSGAAVAAVATNTVTWNGSVAANGGSVTITIEATIAASTPGGTAVSNQGAVNYDGDADGTNEATVLTDDPGQPGAADPTTFYTATRFYTLDPCRLIDTRGPTGALGAPALGPGSRAFTLTGTCGLPADARAVSLNVTVTAPTHPGDLRLYPSDAALPLVSTINYSPGQTRANNAVAVLSAAGALSVQGDQAAGTVELIVDVNGYFK